MALPVINEHSKYSLTIPSSGRTVSFRPFLVKEQKILLTAMESQDQAMMLQAVVDTLKSCIFDELTERELATFDVEYMFTKIRSKSVGESTTVMLKCSKCEEDNKIDVNLNEIEIKIEVENKIKINDQFTVEMRYPNYQDVILLTKLETSSTTEQILEVITACLDKIYTEEEIINIQDEPKEEIINFIDSLNTDQFNGIVNFVMNLPTLKKDIDFKCQSCGKKNKTTIEGLQSFLS